MLLTPWNRILLEKLVKNGTKRFIIAFTRMFHWTWCVPHPPILRLFAMNLTHRVSWLSKFKITYKFLIVLVIPSGTFKSKVLCNMYFCNVWFFWCEVVTLLANPQAGGMFHFGCFWMLIQYFFKFIIIFIQYVCSYCLHSEAVFFIWNNAVLVRETFSMAEHITCLKIN